MKRQIRTICISQVLYRVVLDVIILICLLTLSHNVSIFFSSAVLNSGPRCGFFCGDQSLNYPYRTNSVSRRALYHIAQHVPLLSILLVEIVHFCGKTRSVKINSNGTIKTNTISQSACDNDADRPATSTINPSSPTIYQAKRLYVVHGFFSFLQQIYQPLSCFLFGYAAERLLRSISKHCFPRLRPHFFSVCQPQLLGGGSACGTFSLEQRYVTEYTCLASTADGLTTTTTATTVEMLRGLDSSFPSGHASFTCYSMAFLVLYLRQRLVWQRTRLLRPTLQLCCLMAAWYVSLSRIWDHMHHAWDVAVGMALGAAIAVTVARCVGLSCPPPDVREEQRNGIQMIT